MEHVKCDLLHVACDVRHVICDMWCMKYILYHHVALLKYRCLAAPLSEGAHEATGNTRISYIKRCDVNSLHILLYFAARQS